MTSRISPIREPRRRSAPVPPTPTLPTPQALSLVRRRDANRHSLSDLPREIHEMVLRFLDIETLSGVVRGTTPLPAIMRREFDRYMRLCRDPGVRSIMFRHWFRELYEVEVACVTVTVSDSDTSASASTDSGDGNGEIDGGGDASSASSTPAPTAALTLAADFCERLCLSDTAAAEALLDGCMDATESFLASPALSFMAEAAWQTRDSIVAEFLSGVGEWVVPTVSTLVWCTLSQFGSAATPEGGLKVLGWRLTFDCEAPVWSTLLYDPANRDARQWTTSVVDSQRRANSKLKASDAAPMMRTIERFMCDLYVRAALTSEERATISIGCPEQARGRHHFTSRSPRSALVTRVFARLVVAAAHTFAAVIATRVSSNQWVRALPSSSPAAAAAVADAVSDNGEAAATGVDGSVAKQLARPHTTPLTDHLARLARAFPTFPVRVLYRANPKKKKLPRGDGDGDGGGGDDDVRKKKSGVGADGGPTITAVNDDRVSVATWRGFSVPTTVRAVGAANMRAVRLLEN
jgi:hypothetical protein